MAYSDFSIAELKRRFQLVIEENRDLFSQVPEADVPPLLADKLSRYLPLALNINTEKARSELVIAPVLVEFKLLHQDRISLFSGIDFNVDEASGLKGRCDFILARSPEQLFLDVPVCVLVEAKNENIVGGIPQCLAEMVAAQEYNSRQGLSPTTYGVVTTGTLWRFLQLDGKQAAVDLREYPIQTPRKIFGILTMIALGNSLACAACSKNSKADPVRIDGKRGRHRLREEVAMSEKEQAQLREEMHAIFTPGFPINQQDLFRGRIPQLKKIMETVPSPGRHPIVFGQRGVGKTSFINILTGFYLYGQFPVKVTCDGSDSFKSIWNRVFQKVTIDFKERSFGFSRQESERKINLAAFLGREAEAINGVSPADVATVLSMLKNRAIFIIDEFDRIADEATKTAFADLIKNLSDNNLNATLILVGVGESISDLIGEHPSIARNLVQIEMPLMTDGEIKEIVAKAREKLNVEIDPSVLERIAFLSAGFPHYAHLLGLSTCKACLIRDTRSVNLSLFEELACSLAVEDAIESYRNGLSRATRTSKQSRYPQILCACGIARCDERGVFRATDVVEAMADLFEDFVTVQAVVPALQAFTEEERGAILDKVPLGAQNHYRFREPMMRPFLRIKGRTLKEGLLD